MSLDTLPTQSSDGGRSYLAAKRPGDSAPGAAVLAHGAPFRWRLVGNAVAAHGAPPVEGTLYRLPHAWPTRVRRISRRAFSPIAAITSGRSSSRARSAAEERFWT